MSTPRLLLFGDQTVEKLDAIRKLVDSSKNSPTLRRFLREATDVVQYEVSKLSPSERASFYSFDDLLALAEHNAAEETPNEVCATTLICIVRIGELLLYEESYPGLLLACDSTLHVLGFCTGLLPAAAALMSANLIDLFNYGLEIIAMSVRTGSEIFARSQSVDRSVGSWAYTFIGATAAEVRATLKSFHEAQEIPLHKQIYVGVMSRTWTTCFGPPSTFSKLWKECPSLGLAPKLELPAGGAVHAAHLPCLDVERILGQSYLLRNRLRHNISCISSSTNRPYNASDFGGLLRLMLDDIMQNPLPLTDMMQQVVSDMRGYTQVDVYVAGPTGFTALVQDAIQSENISVKLVRETRLASSMHNKREGSDLIAIVGMSGRFPGGESLQEFWNTLAQGRDLHEEIPPSRFDLNSHFDRNGKKRNAISTPYGCFVKNPGLFDTRVFNISPREAAQMDPMQRLLLMTTLEAMEMAGYSPGGSLSTDRKRIATYIGQATDDWRQNNECQGIDAYYIPGVARVFYPGRLNYHFKWEGGAYSLDAACSSSSTAVHLACSALLSRECDTAVAGGANSLTAPALYAGLSQGSFLSKTGNCKTFRDDADGYCRGEGTGVVVLKRLEDAVAENDEILAVVNGSGRSYSADAVSITQPFAPAQQKLYEHVLRKSGVDPLDIGYVEMHGTGTQAGDPVEVESVKNVFCNGRASNNPLYIGSVKANVGHGEAAAGITSLIKSVLMLRRHRIPPHPNYPFQLNHKLPSLEKAHMKISAAEISFNQSPGKDRKRRIFLNNFDAAGGNTCLIVEEYNPPKKQKGQDPRPFHVVTCSGRTSYSLGENQQRLLQYINSHPGAKICDLAYTTTARRTHDVFRSSYLVQNTAQLAEKLHSDCTEVTKTSSPDRHGSIVFVFSGQGPMYPGMGQELFQTCARFRESILSYQKICDSLGLPPVVHLIAESDTKRTEEASVTQSQLILAFIELALADLWMSWGVKPDLLIGRSLGEYAALCVAGVLSVSDTFYLIGHRAAILQQRCTPFSYAMLVTNGKAEKIEQACKANNLTSCEIACKNAPNQTVASGKVQELERLEHLLKADGLKTTYLRLPFGFHSAQVEPILNDFERSTSSIQFCKPRIPVSSTLTGKIVDDADTFGAKYLTRQTREPVDFVGALRTCQASGKVNEHSLWIEIGPEAPTLGMIRSTLSTPPGRLLPSMKSNEQNWKTLCFSLSAGYLANLSIDWKSLHERYVDALTLLDLPSYAFDLKSFWAPYKQESLGADACLAAVPETTRAPLSTCLQHVVEESFTADSGTATFVSHTSDPKLYAVIQGHKIDGVALCPASVFSEMALTAAGYIYSKAVRTDSSPAMSIHKLEITHPVIVPGADAPQSIRVKASKMTGSPIVKVSFSSAASESSSSHENGSCQIRFGEKDDWKQEFSRTLHLVRKRADSIQSSAVAGQGHRLLRPFVYKLFSSLVHYSEAYQGIEEAFLDEGYRESTARIRLRPNSNAGQFVRNPYWIDNLVHLAGFVLNGDATKPDDVAYMAASIDVFYLIEELSDAEEYTCYVSIQDSVEKKDHLVGDAYVFHGETLMALCAGISFQKMPRKVLAAVLGKNPSGAAVAATRAPQSGVNASANAIRATRENSSKPEAVNVDLSEAQQRGRTKPRDNAPLTRDSISEQLLDLVASESGFEREDMESGTSFADMGVDSLMSITIISAAKNNLGLELPAAFFQNYPTVHELQQQLSTPGTDEEEEDDSSSNVSSSSDRELSASETDPSSSEENSSSLDDSTHKPRTGTTSPNSSTTPPSSLEQHKPPVQTLPTAAAEPQPSSDPNPKLVLLQGRPTSSLSPLFLATDGAGSATAYIHLPPLPQNRRMYALESPYLSNPEHYNCTVEQFCALWIASIRALQPHGPYYLGGWSAGAVYAYELARQLTAQGDAIQFLFLMDMRVPKPMTDAIEPNMALIEQAGLVTGIKRTGQILTEASTRLKAHLVATVKALIRYQPVPLDPAQRPAHAVIVWAKRGISEEGAARMQDIDRERIEQENQDKNVMADQSTGIKGWFFAQRKAFGPNGWDEMVGAAIECETVEADHFSMVQHPGVKTLGKILRSGIEKAERKTKE